MENYQEENPYMDKEPETNNRRDKFKDKFEYPESKSQKPSNSIIVYVMGIFLAIFVGATIFFAVSNQNKENKIEEKDTTINELDSEIKSLEKDIAEKENQLTTSVNEKEDLVNELKGLQEKITNYKFLVDRMIKDHKTTKDEKAALQGKYDQLKYYDDRNKLKITELQNQIETLKIENEGLKSTIGQRDQQISQMGDEITIQNNTIEAASKLSATGFVFTVSYGGKEKELDENDKRRASRTKSITANFVIPRNSAAKKDETRIIYMVIKTPGGRIMSGQASGVFMTESSESQFSCKTTAKFSGETTPVSMQFTKSENQPFEKGTSMVVLYAQEPGQNSAYLMGRGSFQLK